MKKQKVADSEKVTLTDMLEFLNGDAGKQDDKPDLFFLKLTSPSPKKKNNNNQPRP